MRRLWPICHAIGLSRSFFTTPPAGGAGGALHRTRPQRATHPAAARRPGGQAPEPREARPAAAASARAGGAPRERER
eukprot:scaffold68997_cov63-Phaeocystis_antarctica.AAC.2